MLQRLAAGLRGRATASRGIADPDICPLEVLSRAGLHESVISRRDQARTPAATAAVAIALAETNQAEAAAEIAALCQGEIRPADRRRLAVALARQAPQAALAVLGARDPLVAAAIRHAHGDAAGAAGDLARAGARRRPVEWHLLASALAATRGDHRCARREVNAAFLAQGLAAPLDDTTPEPISLGAFDRDLGSARSAGGPVVSVIMAAHDAAHTISVAVRSILRQSWASLELIVVDDASTDATVEEARAAAGGDPRLRLLATQAGPRGVHGARNAGLAEARGDWITFQDADDWSHPERLRRDLAAVLRSRQPAASCSRLVRLATSGTLAAPRIFPVSRLNRSAMMLPRAAALADLGYFEEIAPAADVGADEEYMGRIRACWGPGRLIQRNDLLAVASLSAHSLTSAAATGIHSASGLVRRLGYRERWHRWHVQAVQASDRRANALCHPVNACRLYRRPD